MRPHRPGPDRRARHAPRVRRCLHAPRSRQPRRRKAAQGTALGRQPPRGFAALRCERTFHSFSPRLHCLIAGRALHLGLGLPLGQFRHRLSRLAAPRRTERAVRHECHRGTGQTRPERRGLRTVAGPGLCLPAERPPLCGRGGLCEPLRLGRMANYRGGTGRTRGLRALGHLHALRLRQQVVRAAPQRPPLPRTAAPHLPLRAQRAPRRCGGV